MLHSNALLCQNTQGLLKLKLGIGPSPLPLHSFGQNKSQSQLRFKVLRKETPLSMSGDTTAYHKERAWIQGRVENWDIFAINPSII